MSRALVTGFGGVLAGLVVWFVVGFGATMVLGRMPGGQREGMAATTGLLFVGPIAGIIGLIAGGWLVWKFTADPARIGSVAMGLFGLFAVILIGGFLLVAMRPSSEVDIPGKVLVEVRLAAKDAEPNRLRFELRAGAGTQTVAADGEAVRSDDQSLIVPGAFRLGSMTGSNLFAVMNGEHQIATGTINLPETPASTDWSPWSDLREGTALRWRLVLHP